MTTTVDPTVDVAALARWLDAQAGLTTCDLGPPGAPLSARFITGGASNDLFEITRGQRRMALRKPPAIVPPGRNETMLREYRLLAALAGTDVPHAVAIVVGDDPAVLGSCFYMMELVDGWSPIQSPHQLLDRYQDVSGRPVDEIDYYVILARFKLAIVLEAGYARAVKGQSDNPKMTQFGPVVLEMALKAAELAASTSLR